ncbi:MAG: rhomboid family intramembrane serine protease [Chloroflexia bacterium]
MIPLGDEGTPAQRGLPIVNLTIIALNVLMFIVQVMLGDPFTNGWSLIPREITTGQDLMGVFPVPGFDAQIELTGAPLGIPYLTLLTSMFMHGGLLHIGSNMLFLFIFGDNVEDNFGSLKYLVFYLACGLGASFAQIFLGDPASVIPNVGASGAIAGVMGAYIVLFRQARVRVLIPLGRVSTINAVPAFLMIGVWIATQLLSVFVLEEQTTGGGVAYWAHIGGFVVGLLLVFLFRDSSRD